MAMPRKPKKSATSEAVPKGSKSVVHRLGCKWAKKIATENLIGCDTDSEAIEDGHVPCKACRP